MTPPPDTHIVASPEYKADNVIQEGDMLLFGTDEIYTELMALNYGNVFIDSWTYAIPRSRMEAWEQSRQVKDCSTCRFDGKSLPVCLQCTKDVFDKWEPTNIAKELKTNTRANTETVEALDTDAIVRALSIGHRYALKYSAHATTVEQLEAVSVDMIAMVKLIGTLQGGK